MLHIGGVWVFQIDYLGKRGGSDLGTVVRTIMVEVLGQGISTRMNWEGRGKKIGFHKFKIAKCCLCKCYFLNHAHLHTSNMVK